MKNFHLGIGVVLFVTLASIAFFFLSGTLQGSEAWSDWLEHFLKGRQLLVASGSGVILCLLVLYVLTGLNMPGRIQYLAYDNEGGAVSISLKAVEGFLARLMSDFSQVVALQPRLRLIVNQVDVQLDIKVKAGAQIPELCKMLQEAARNCLNENVGISDVREVRVRVQEIVGQPTAATSTSSGDSPVAF